MILQVLNKYLLKDKSIKRTKLLRCSLTVSYAPRSTAQYTLIKIFLFLMGTALVPQLGQLVPTL